MAGKSLDLMPLLKLLGPRIEVTEMAMVKRWIPPKHRFFEYEPKDEGWCRKLGIGQVVSEPGALLVTGLPSLLGGGLKEDILYVHPKVYAEMQKQGIIKGTDLHFAKVSPHDTQGVKQPNRPATG